MPWDRGNLRLNSMVAVTSSDHVLRHSAKNSKFKNYCNFEILITYITIIDK